MIVLQKVSFVPLKFCKKNYRLSLYNIIYFATIERFDYFPPGPFIYSLSVTVYFLCVKYCTKLYVMFLDEFAGHIKDRRADHSLFPSEHRNVRGPQL